MANRKAGLYWGTSLLILLRVSCFFALLILFLRAMSSAGLLIDDAYLKTSFPLSEDTSIMIVCSN